MALTALKPSNFHGQRVCLLAILFFSCLFNVVVSISILAERLLHKYGIIPDVIDAAPDFTIDVSHHNRTLRMGEKIDPAEMQRVPKLMWPARAGTLFTLLMIDPDVPVRKNPTLAERQHYIVGNIKGCDFRHGQEMTGYIGPFSAKHSGLHRTTFLVYSQNSHVQFDEPRYPSVRDGSFKQRYKFSARKFAEKYNLTLFAVNFFMTGWPLYQITRKPTAPKYNPFREHFAPSPMEV
ncbi:unnamed protein product [Bemisia tabaci]|uniref:Uncharacterized protein n=1 Tax=Bemisia tabaci TaxID=7038 RepID=A0A9P0F358_BEMTA|nr:unnamed protein product [Bemisia tabaci]